jgi:hypothetical protein
VVATTLVGEANSDMFGISVSSAGDVDGDTYGDVIVGAANHNIITGRAYLFRGSISGLLTTPATIITGEEEFDGLGYSVSGAGNVNGDAFDDVVIAAFGDGLNRRVMVYLGSAGGLSSTPATTVSGASASGFAISLSDAGDVNGDGFGDVIVGADIRDNIGDDNAGAAFVYHGSSLGLSTVPATTLLGTDASSAFGFAVSGAGDLDGDGYDDIIVGAPGTNGGWGATMLYAGSSAGVASTAMTTLSGTSFMNHGYSVSTAGDVNADGYADVIVGAAQYYGMAGAAYVHLGYPDPTDDNDGDGYPVSADCDDWDSTINPGATEVCDASDTDEDCDGLTDDDDTTASGKTTVYADTDADGYGSSTTATFCDVPTGYVSTSTDCDDTDPAIHPEAAETVGDEIDSDCDGSELCFLDEDGDGYRPDDADAIAASEDMDCTDSGEAASATPTGDCEDSKAEIHPGAEELCNGIDDDCDGSEPDCDGGVDTGLTDTVGGVCGCDLGRGHVAWTPWLVPFFLAVRRRRALTGAAGAAPMLRRDDSASGCRMRIPATAAAGVGAKSPNLCGLFVGGMARNRSTIRRQI